MIAPIVLVSLLLRLLVCHWGHSGQGKPPMFGDFEAQRHWLEVTYHLPIGDWYRNTTSSDLQYWGLDYPPLTAYVSFAFASVAEKLHPQVIAWETSRGYEQPLGKFFMRMTVILSDIVVLIPAVYLVLSKTLPKMKSVASSTIISIAIISNPALLLIDHGHFQYNGVCLGLALLAAYFISDDRDLLGSVFFCLSLNFKQMALYYSPVFFFGLLYKCLQQRSFLLILRKFMLIGMTVITTFALLWAPFCISHSPEETCLSSLQHVLQRQFPFARGIFEDKVGNIWYALSVIIDFRFFLTVSQLLSCSFTLTLLLLSPVGLYLLTHKVSLEQWLWSMIVSALSFFLASFQVHEKSILLASVPCCLLWAVDKRFVSWFQFMAMFSMFPLLKKDELVLAYWVCGALFAMLLHLGQHPVILELDNPTDEYKEDLPRLKPQPTLYWCRLQLGNKVNVDIFKLFLAVSFSGMAALHLLEATIVPSMRYPDLYPALFAIFSAGNFVVAYVYVVLSLWLTPASNSDSSASRKKVD